MIRFQHTQTRRFHNKNGNDDYNGWTLKIISPHQNKHWSINLVWDNLNFVMIAILCVCVCVHVVCIEPFLRFGDEQMPQTTGGICWQAKKFPVRFLFPLNMDSNVIVMDRFFHSILWWLLLSLFFCYEIQFSIKHWKDLDNGRCNINSLMQAVKNR